MKINDTITTVKGMYELEYQDAVTFNHLQPEKITQVYGVCFYQDLIILGKTFEGKWMLPGGTVEPGEAIEQTLVREIKEESNMRVLHYQPIGIQKLWNHQTPAFYQVRYYCQVEPYGPFEYDTAEDGGSIESIWAIKPEEVSGLLNWGKVGERIVQRAINFHSSKK